MACLPIVIYGDKILRAKSRPVEVFSNSVATLAEDMIETMHSLNALGLPFLKALR